MTNEHDIGAEIERANEVILEARAKGVRLTELGKVVKVLIDGPVYGESVWGYRLSESTVRLMNHPCHGLYEYGDIVTIESRDDQDMIPLVVGLASAETASA